MLKKLAAKMEGLAAKMEGGGGSSLVGKQLAVGGQTVKVDKLLGEGGFATIYRCIDVDTGATYALKHFILTAYPDAEYDALKEVAVMQALHGCPTAVRLHAAAPLGPPGGAPTAACALMEYCPGTLVGHLAARGGVLTDSEVVEVMLAVAVVVRAMHALDPPLAHRDLKAENVLQAADGRWVLCDFGSVSSQHGVLAGSREIALEEEVVRRYTTPAYRAPELFDLYAREYLGPPVDIWALGVLLYLLAFGRLPFEGEAKLQVLNGRYAMPEGRSPALRSLVADMLRVSPRERPAIEQVVTRLAALAPPELVQQLQVDCASPAAPAGMLASHQRFPSQGWADFAAETSPVAGGSRGASRAGSRAGSGSWATFSPKKHGGGEEEGGLLAAEDGAVASAGSFWSSFDEVAPAEAQAPPPQQAAAPPAQQQQPAPAQQQLQQQQLQQQRQPAVSAASTAASAAAPAPAAASTPPPGKAAAAMVPPDASPLSAGLSRMSQASRVGDASVAKPAAPASVLPGRGNTGMMPAGAQHQGTAAAAALPPATTAAAGSAGEAEGLRQHCLVLEQLLESRNEEVRRLQRQVEQQGAEIRQLRQQLELAQQGGQRQAPSGGTSVVAAAAVPATAAASSVATPASSRMGQDLSLQVPGTSSTPQGGSWVSFSATGGRRDAPTPTLLQPAGGGSFKGSSRASASGGSGGGTPAAGTMSAAGATPAGSTAQLEQQLRHKLDLSMRTDNLGRALSLEAPPPPPMRGSSSVNGGSAKPLQSFPVQLTPALGDGSRSAPASAKPSPIRQGSSGQLSALGSGQGGSPMKARPASGLAAADPSGSPTKGHKRNLTAPNAFFEDLNPIH